MKMLSFAWRNTKEILRDPLTSAFSLGFPVVLLLLMSAIQANIPVNIFEIQNLAPGIAVFGLSFMTLFSATLIAKDRESALLNRLYTTPLSAFDFILGYLLPILPIAISQGVITYALAVILGLQISVKLLLAVALLVPISLLYIGMGLLFGSILNVKAVGGVCGGLLTNAAAWLSGAWFDIALVGGVFGKIANALPFVHAVELERAVLRGDYAQILPQLSWVLAYAVAVNAIAVVLFLRQMKK